LITFTASGAGTKRWKTIFAVPLHFFGSTSTISLVVLASAFVMSSTVGQFFVRCSTHGAPFVNLGGVSPCPMESAPVFTALMLL